jgi:hypothetical protein
VALVARIAPLRLIIAGEPCVAVGVPPQVLLSPDGLAMFKPLGKTALKLSPVSMLLLEPLVIVKVREVVPFTATLVAPNAAAMLGGGIVARAGPAATKLVKSTTAPSNFTDIGISTRGASTTGPTGATDDLSARWSRYTQA